MLALLQDVSTHFRAFFDHADADFLTGFGGLLLQSAGGGQARRAGADDDHVEFHVFAFHRLSPTQGSTVFFLIWRFDVVSVIAFTLTSRVIMETHLLSRGRIISTPL